jgi:lysophospholipase L1-like esterase
MMSLRTYLLVCLASVVLAACGGGGGGGGASNTDSLTVVPDADPPTVPQNLSGTAVGHTQVDLSWNAATDVGGGVVIGYKVYRNGTLVASVSSGTSYRDTGLMASTTYSYTVSAYDNAVPANESAQSSPPVSVTTPLSTDTDPPTVPQNFSATASSPTQVDLTWNVSTDAGGGVVAGYKVFRNGGLVASVPSGTSYIDAGLTANTTYSYTVSAYDDATPANESAQSSPPVSVTTPLPTATEAPTVPQNLSATVINSSQVNLSWSASMDSGGGMVAGYKVYRDGAQVASVSSGTVYSDSGLTERTTYAYTVSAYDNAATPNESAQSSPVSATTPAALGLPLTYDFSTGDVSAWTNVNDSGIASTWTVSGGAYRQGTDVGEQTGTSTPFDQSYKRGTYVYLPGLTALTAYQVSVDITPLHDIAVRDPFDGQDVGVMFRYQDNNNYYRVSFSARESFARLEKKVGGVYTTLATNARGYVEGQTFRVTVNLSGNLIEVSRGGDPVFAVRDTSLPSGTVALYCQDAAQFDNVVIDNSDPNPTLVVSTPLAHSVQTGATVTGAAVVTNKPAGGSVDFSFGAAGCAAASESPAGSGFYTASCGTPGPGDYYLPGQGLVANLRNSGGGVVASDANLRVGVQGNQYFTVGDSLTLGTYDFYTPDNHSLDDREIGQQGYQARLGDLLTAATGKPTLVFNDGVGGDRTTDTLTRINSILERHAGANRMLLLLGTNDASGGTPTSQGLYQANLQSLVDTARAQGKTVWVAKVPPALPSASNTSRNATVRGYNTAIGGLTNIQAGPDFYAFFYDNNGTPSNSSDDYERLSLYYNSLHPNALGYHIMAQLWNNAITGATTVPFYLDRLCNRLVSSSCTDLSPTNHKQNLLETGYPPYTDESYTLTSIPAALADGIWIQTANAESGNTAASYIDFTVDRPVTVYVAYDAGAASPPTWLTGNYANTGLTVQTTDPNSPTLKVYSRTFAAGAVSLGGNLASGASGANSNYLAIVVQQ